MENRQEYFKNYYKEHKQEIINRSKEDYQNNKKERLQSARKRYILKREVILLKLKKQSVEFIGHAQAIHKAVVKYAKEWKLPYSEWNEFKQWTVDDPVYEELFKAWKESGYDKSLSPVAMREVKKNGFVVGNLTWDTKSKYSWWNEDKTLLEHLQKIMNEEQILSNKGTKEQVDIIRKQMKKRKFKK